MRYASALLIVTGLLIGGCGSDSSRPVPADHPANPDSIGPMKTQTGDAGAGAMPTTRASATYTCPMHPEVVTDHPGSCPKCGMTLVKKGLE